MSVPGPGEYRLPGGNQHLRIRLDESFSPEAASNHHVFFDADLLCFPLKVRSLAPGDRLRPWGTKGTRKVSRILMDAKVPRHLRLRVPLLVDGDRVLWVAGHRRSDLAPVRENTRRIFSARLLPCK